MDFLVLAADQLFILMAKSLEVCLVEKIRDEEKFNSVDELIAQMKNDEKKGKEILKKLIN